MSDALLEIADELYGLPLPEFTPARDALVRAHKADRALAGAVKGLKKASVAAWVVNLLVRRDPDQVEQVLSVGAALREAAASLDAGQLRELTRQRRQLTAAVTTSARRLAREEGLKVTQAVADQVESTLTAAMLDPDAARAVRSGLLVSPLESTGLGDLDLSGAVAVPEALGFEATARPAATRDPAPDPTVRPQLHVVRDPEARAKAIAAAEEKVGDAEAALGEAQAAARKATKRLDRLEARTLQLQAEIEELRTRIAEHEASLEEIDEEVAEAEEARDEAVTAAEDARSDLEAARHARERLG